jgi:hypothetical protein
MSQNASIDLPQISPQPKKPRFRGFPAEILELIWAYTLEDATARIIEIKKSKRPWLPWYCSTPIPALLHVCSRSRFLAQKHWEPSFPYGGRQPGQARFSRIWFNFEKDILYFSRETISLHEYLNQMKRNERNRIRNVAFELPLQGQDEQYLDINEGANVAGSLFNIWPELKMVEFINQGTSYMTEFEDEFEVEDEA